MLKKNHINVFMLCWLIKQLELLDIILRPVAKFVKVHNEYRLLGMTGENLYPRILELQGRRDRARLIWHYLSNAEQMKVRKWESELEFKRRKEYAMYMHEKRLEKQLCVLGEALDDLQWCKARALHQLHLPRTSQYCPQRSAKLSLYVDITEKIKDRWAKDKYDRVSLYRLSNFIDDTPDELINENFIELVTYSTVPGVPDHNGVEPNETEYSLHEDYQKNYENNIKTYVHPTKL